MPVKPESLPFAAHDEQGAVIAPETPPEPRLSRRERIQRRKERIARRAARNARKAAPPAQISAQVAGHDPLRVTDRQGRPADLSGLWSGCAGFLVLGGPSTRKIEGLAGILRERGVVSMGVNNVAGALPVRAMTFSDPPEKFHHGIFFDPAMMKFVPEPKLRRGQVRIKYPDGWFSKSGLHVRDFPNVWGYKRIAEWRADQFLTTDGATWGNNDAGVKATGGEKCLCTMLLGLRLMHYLGCPRVYLLGADFRMAPDAGYSFGQARDEGACRSNNNIYRVANKFLCEVRPVLDAAGFRVYNTNPASALEAFDFASFEQAYLDCKNVVPPEPFSLTNWYDFKNEGRAETDK